MLALASCCVNIQYCQSRRKWLFSDNDTSFILHDIFANYDKRVIPFTDGPVVINMTIVLGILVELRENEQLAAYVISHTQRWYDRRLQWDPELYRGQKEVSETNPVRRI
ncbi:hypothetical protein COOONC_11457 [Cooperia oncophora]